MTQRFQGKKVLVVGASGGIGSVIARALVEEGALVTLSARSKEKLEAVAETIGKPDQTLVVPADATKADDVESLFSHLECECGGVDFVVLAAGAYQSLGLDADLESASKAFEKLTAVNLVGPWLVAFKAAQFMKEQGHGHIVNISSHAAVRVLSNDYAYRPGKAAVSAFMESLYEELKPLGVKVTDVRPATVNTEVMAGILSPEQQEQAIQPDDLAQVILDMLGSPRHQHTPHLLVDADTRFD